MKLALEVRDLRAGYGKVDVLHGLSFEVPQGKVVSLLGPNGAGKTTSMITIAGLLRASSGAILLDGADISGSRPDKIVVAGLVLVPQGRELFPGLSVMDNLFLGGHTVSSQEEVRSRIDAALGYFPDLATRTSQRAGSLSGGEQQMLAIARGLVADPQVLLLDEPSAGLAPLITRDVLQIVRRVCDERGVTALLAEQNATQALRISDHAYILETGEIVADGTPEELLEQDRLAASYLGDVGDTQAVGR